MEALNLEFTSEFKRTSCHDPLSNKYLNSSIVSSVTFLLLCIRVKAVDCQIILNKPYYPVAVILRLETKTYFVRTVELVIKIMVACTFINEFLYRILLT
jgi:hypothetical protein